MRGAIASPCPDCSIVNSTKSRSVGSPFDGGSAVTTPIRSPTAGSVIQ